MIELPLYHHFTSLDSTNTLALTMAEQGAEHGTVIHADSQTGGRGRGSREFISPPGGLYFSLILKPDIDPVILPLITLAAGLGLHKGIRAVTGMRTGLKWPNDLYFENRKLAGILTESGPVRQGGQVEFVVIGAGINIGGGSESFPLYLREKIISLSEVATTKVNIDILLPCLIKELLLVVQRLEVGATGRIDLLAEWRRLDYLLGKPLEYVSQGQLIPAVGAGLTDDGQYEIVARHGVQYQVTAGVLNPIRPVF